jgi:hypothetical protein
MLLSALLRDCRLGVVTTQVGEQVCWQGWIVFETLLNQRLIALLKVQKTEAVPPRTARSWRLLNWRQFS